MYKYFVANLYVIKCNRFFHVSNWNGTVRLSSIKWYYQSEKYFYFFRWTLFERKKERFSRMFFFSSYKWINSIQIFISNRTWFSKFFGKKKYFMYDMKTKKMSSEICWSSEINKINKSRCKTATIDHLNGFLPIYPESWFYWNEILIPNQMYRMYQFWHNQRCTLISGFIE